MSYFIYLPLNWLMALAVLGALAGGLVLNIMPCVFPVLSLKALSLARGSVNEAEARREALLVQERAAREDAEAATRLRDEFLASVSHELRTPLTAIKGYVDLLVLGAAGPISETQASFLGVVKNNANRLMDLINIH